MRVHRPGTDGAAAHTLKIVSTPYDSPDSQRLIDQLQAEYVWRYGGRDSTPVAAGEFEPPKGLFLVGYDGAVPVAMGGWRWHDPGTSGSVPGSSPAEIKRMYVSEPARGGVTPARSLPRWRRLLVRPVSTGWSWRPGRRSRRPSRSTGAADTSRSRISDTTQTHRSRCTSESP
jgi:hypothetical protein